MTRAQRRTRARKLGQLRAESRTFAVGVQLNENPNRAKHHAARMTDAFCVELARDTAKSYRATLTSHERYRRSDGRRLPDRRESDGSPSPASYATTYGKSRDWRPTS